MASVVAVVLSGTVAAQAQISPPATRPAPAASTESSKASIAAKVEHWSKARWEAAKKEWAKDAAKWANCQKQWNKSKHEDRKSWPSVYRCMMS